MDEFIKTLTEEQKTALLKALSGGEVPDEPFTTHAPFIAGSEEPISKAVDGNFQMKKPTDRSPRRSTVRAGKNTWVDEGELKDIKTPDIKPTPRNRKAPKKKEVICRACGKTFKINASLVFGESYRCERCIGG